MFRRVEASRSFSHLTVDGFVMISSSKTERNRDAEVWKSVEKKGD